MIKKIEPKKDLFIISRTSCSSEDDIGVVGLKKCLVKRIDIRSCDDPKKIPSHNGTNGDWYEKGTNHRVEDGFICRDMGYDEEYYIEGIDILEFVKEHGECILYINHQGFNCIEIYDDYRE